MCQTISDPDEPAFPSVPPPRQSKKSGASDMAGKGILKPAFVPSQVEPHQVPLPKSRAGTHRRDASSKSTSR